MPHSPGSKLNILCYSGAEPGIRQQLDRASVAAVLGLIRLYKYLISPLFRGCCRFHPSCASYTAEAVETFGVGRGLRLGIGRLLRCRPWGGHGFDPVPRN